MTGDETLQFVEHLRHHHHLAKPAGSGEHAGRDGDRSQGKLWELADLSASDFADEAARFFALDRVTLQDMLSAPPTMKIEPRPARIFSCASVIASQPEAQLR